MALSASPAVTSRQAIAWRSACRVSPALPAAENSRARRFPGSENAASASRRPCLLARRRRPPHPAKGRLTSRAEGASTSARAKAGSRPPRAEGASTSARPKAGSPPPRRRRVHVPPRRRRVHTFTFTATVPLAPKARRSRPLHCARLRFERAVVPGDGTIAFCELGRVSAAQAVKERSALRPTSAAARRTSPGRPKARRVGWRDRF
jgi:hypothetical protein